MIPTVMFLFLALAPCEGSNASGRTALRIELPPVPVYPTDGQVPPHLKERYAFHDTNTDELVVAFPEDLGKTDGMAGRMIVERQPLAIGVCPVLTATVRNAASGGFEYEYHVENQAAARQDVATWVLSAGTVAGAKPLILPQIWRFSAVADSEEIKENALGAMSLTWGPDQLKRARQIMLDQRIEWFAWDDEYGITPGQKVGPFRMFSPSRPGIVRAYVQGSPSKVGTRSEWPAAVTDQLWAFNFTENNSVSLSVIGPKFPPGVGRTAMASDFLRAMEEMIDAGELSRVSAFSTEAVAYLGRVAKQPATAARGPGIVAVPTTNLERQILLAIRTSLQ